MRETSIFIAGKIATLGRNFFWAFCTIWFMHIVFLINTSLALFGECDSKIISFNILIAYDYLCSPFIIKQKQIE